ncbi:hypothetical protein AAFF_G00393900 [Aldrovandia affinis]|uniref:Uncharacterized protein n=1 Tax=Aldrovandia affinis TaxID=143900 RepID=A0AAD7SDJ3_9TELE|nr:hypothetical protein AAFF_G00393900 [Aldrovandia affinis]
MQDHEAVALLKAKTVRVEVDRVLHCATPLVRKKDMPSFRAQKEAVMPSLRSTERRLAKDLERAMAYSAEIQKLIQVGSASKLSFSALNNKGESWYITHHMVSHNGKNRCVFNFSFQFQGQSLNESLLPGPTLGASLLGVLLRFHEHPVTISGDIKGMFHQVRLLPEDRPLLRFMWRDVKIDEPPDIFEWKDLLQAWNDWEGELRVIPSIHLARCYLPADVDQSSVTRDVHVFCDASRVAPKPLHSMQKLELCVAVTGAQLTKVIQKDLTLKVDQTILWTDSTTVLTWLQSESCRFKVFIGTRVAKILKSLLTSIHGITWIQRGTQLTTS